MPDSFNKTAESKRPIIHFKTRCGHVIEKDNSVHVTDGMRCQVELHAIKDSCNSVFLYGALSSSLLPNPNATPPRHISLTDMTSIVVMEHHDALMGMIDQFKTFRPDLARNPQLIALQNAAKARH